VSKEALLEHEIRQTQKLNAIGTLAGGIAHDFNNILMPIIGYAEVMKSMVTTGSDMNKYLGEIHSAGKRAQELISQILTFSRQSEQSFKPVEIHLIVREALKLLRASIPVTVDIEESINKDSGSIIGDPTQIHQIVINLCLNAAHAMKMDGGQLKVSLEVVSASDTDKGLKRILKRGDYLLMIVKDTGTGIDTDILDRIFEPFFTTKPEGEGAGMGLAVVHGIIENHGGHIDVKSELGVGTEVFVYLPKYDGPTKRMKVRSGKVKKGEGHILVVDDQISVVNTIVSMLDQMNYTTTSTINSREALELFKKNPDQFDLVLSDMTMPRMTGDKLATAIINIRDDIPVLLMTGYSDVISAEEVSALGVRELINKPISPRELSEVIYRELNH
jgi:nitrogen-specific signal transduction histidine kinase